MNLVKLAEEYLGRKNLKDLSKSEKMDKLIKILGKMGKWDLLLKVLDQLEENSTERPMASRTSYPPMRYSPMNS